MNLEKNAATENCAAARRGDDTHWWKAYELHSKAPPGTATPVRARSTDPASLAPVEHARAWHTETEIHRAVSKALQPL